MVYSNNIFRLLEYEFTDLRYYNSLRLVQERNYSLEEIEITLDDFIRCLGTDKGQAGTGGYLYPGGQLLQGYFTGGTAERESDDGRGDRAAFGFKGDSRTIISTRAAIWGWRRSRRMRTA